MTEEKQIKKGFNAGYQLEKHDPELSKTIQKGFKDKTHPYAQGFTAGSQEFAKERSIDNSLLSKYMNKGKEHGKAEKLKDKDFDLER